MMATGSDVNQHAVFVEECEGLDKLERLQNHPNKDIYKKALQILRTYFETDELVGQCLFPYPDIDCCVFRTRDWSRKRRPTSSRLAARTFPVQVSNSLKLVKWLKISLVI
jgi:hypothetical protein